MRTLAGHTLGIVAIAAVLLTVAVPTAVAQAGAPNACAFVDADELKKLTGRRDVMGTGPEASGAGSLPKTMSQCDYLGFGFALTTGATSATFATNREREAAKATRWKVQSVSGLGDEAYHLWDYRPGSNRNVGVVFRVGNRQMAIGDLTSADSVEAMKSVLLKVGKAVAARMR